MKRKHLYICLICLLCLVSRASAQDSSLLSAIAELCGVGDPEDIPPEELERYMHYASHPLRINQAGEARLLSSGILSQYQAASITDYRRNEGDVLSFSELAALDGFGEAFVKAIASFISLSSGSVPGTPADSVRNIRSTLQAKGGIREDFGKGGKPETTYGFKYVLEADRGWEIGIAARSGFSEPAFPPASYGFSTAIYPGHGAWKIIAGDFNARFGQGLALWSGMVIDSYSSIASFYRRPGGLSPSYSWSSTATHRGLAADFTAGHFTVSSFVSAEGLREKMQGKRNARIQYMPGLNLGWRWSHSTVSCTGVWKKDSGLTGSMEGRASLWGCDLFAEGVYVCGQPRTPPEIKAAGGLVFPLGKGRSAVRAEWKSGSLWRGAAGYENGSFVFSAEYRYQMEKERHQTKLFVRKKLEICESLSLTLRGTCRWRPYEGDPVRISFRGDLAWKGGAWQALGRVEYVHCRKNGVLTYAEFGRQGEKFFFWVRGTWYSTDGWTDRIYCYERDAPGNFNVPAYYGNGTGASLYGGYAPGRGRGGMLIKTYARLWFRSPGMSLLNMTLRAEF
ncbi:MAG: hypothetical protein II770_07550 [Bacteroidales bacterium]|nr:hypothetical protein [Bacteroidales bacterium]